MKNTRRLVRRWIWVAGLVVGGVGVRAEVVVKVGVMERGGKAVEISPFVYGVNQNPGGDIGRFPLVRQGGNRMTAWNWETNASNAGHDWHHQSDDYLGGGDVAGAVARSFIEPAVGRGQVALVTVPMAGYVAGDKGADGDVNKTPDYLEKRFKKSVARKPGGRFQFPPDVGDGVVYQDEFVDWVEKEFVKKGGGKVWYALDNEPDLWSETHARIHPSKLTYGELIERTVELSSAIKGVAPEAMVFGFVSYGYGGFSTLQGAADGKGRFFVDVFLQEMAAAEKKRGRRLVDVLDLHWYPETRGGGIRITEKGDGKALREARMQAPRHLYDSGFREESWIDKDAVKGAINLLPTMMGKIEKFYPGTKLALTEYNYGGGEDISGTIAHADALGAFGNAGVFAVCWWQVGEKNPYTAAAYDLFLNYDGKGGKFGSEALRTESSDLAKVSAWAARTKEGKVTLMLINRSSGEERVKVMGVDRGMWKAFRVSGVGPRVEGAGEVEVGESGVVVGGESVVLLVSQ